MKLRKPLRCATIAAFALLASGSAVAQTACVLTCPANVTLATAPGGQEVAYSYVVTTSGNCGAGGIVQTAGLPSGASFPVGTTYNYWRAVSDAQATCNFGVTVTATPPAARPSEPIPLLGPLGLGLLAAALAGGGALAARRRSTRR